jgi:hypothetical protein
MFAFFRVPAAYRNSIEDALRARDVVFSPAVLENPDRKP